MEQFDYRQPFIFYRLPGDTGYHIEHTPTFDGLRLRGKDICISPWLDTPFGNMTVETHSTSHQDYVKTIETAAANARARNGKTVIARQICGVFDEFRPIDMALKYFEPFGDMFCFMFYHPATGYWMGASPELLVTADGSTGSTRALAGTRSSDIHGDWDEKNICEHEMVVNDIINNIMTSNLDIDCERSPMSTLKYGDIEHLCTPIKLHNKVECRLPIDRITALLHPTAAVGGYPRKEALSDIAMLETKPRKFYAGVISTDTTAYVILRCVHFDQHNWCIYTGSGITGMSNPEDEWLETHKKAMPLLSILNGNHQYTTL